ncbi:unnamed protein product [Protopolystoma xenopodis]|uniref:Sec20 C-terminal domain-containing protein n=1 Tax=Protopolystoma xenopodis TaxID=117903 RepID=A0A448WSY6_9PLAT|nr:unnamed protein product [Protopolystoma xenopodis]
MIRPNIENLLRSFVASDASVKSCISLIEDSICSIKYANEFRTAFEKLQHKAKSNLLEMREILLKLYIDNDSSPPLHSLKMRSAASNNKRQFHELQDSYNKVVLKGIAHLEKLEKASLIYETYGRSNKTTRNYHDLDDDLTQELQSHARSLAEQVALSSSNATLAVDSSQKISDNANELREMSGELYVSSRLAKRLSRRRFTDRVLFTLAFLFYFLTCAYIFIKRSYK